ncbi:MAG: hypothetical protein K8R92_06895 [Planctomycetes bacterium]|nr:hypothetical protein [Planctomycetota bacterium]
MILIRAEDRPSRGRGHRSRAEALAHACLRAKLPATMLAGDLEWSRELSKDGLHAEPLSEVGGDATEARQLAGAAKRLAATHVVLDGGRFVPGFVKALAESGIRVVLVDDTARADVSAAWAVINPNIYATKSLYTHPHPDRIFAGPDYILLRPPFLKPRSAPTSSAVVLLAMGVSASDALLADLTARIETLGMKPVVARNKSAVEMAAAIDASEVVICGASVTLHEVWARTRKAIPVYQARDQELFWKWCAGLSIPTAVSLDRETGDVAKAIADLLGKIRDGRAAPQPVVDLGGGDRIVEQVLR